MDAETIDNIKAIFAKHSEVKLAYLFGSRARGDTGPMSDYDFAVHLEESDSKKRFDLKIKLMVELGQLLKTGEADVVGLNDTDAPELAYEVVKDGILLHDEEPYRITVEPRILNEYFDFHLLLKKYGLTRVP